MQPKLIVTFGRHSESGFQTKAGVIISALTANPRFVEPWPAPAPTLVSLSDALDSYRSAYNATTTRDSAKIVQRKVARHTLTELLKRLAPYLEFVAHGDVEALASTGYDLRRDTNRTSGFEPLPAPGGFRVQHGPHRGSLDVRITRVPGAASYEVQITQGDPTSETDWKHAMTSVTASRIRLNDLPPTQAFWVRVRCVGSGGNGRWTEPVNIIVV